VKLERDGLTWLTYVQLGAHGFFLYGSGATLGLLREDLDVSRAVAGLHGTANAAGALISAMVIGALVRRHGRAHLMWLGLAFLVVGVSCYASVAALPLTLGGTFVAAFGGSCIVVLSSAVLADRHGQSSPAAISEANAAAAGIGGLAPLAVGAAVALGLGWRVALLVIVPYAIVIAVVGRAVHVPPPVPLPEDTVKARLPGRYWVSWVVVTAGIAVEFCVTLWAADLLYERTDLARGAAAATVAAIVIGMFLGRIVGGRLVLRRSVDVLLQFAIALAGLGFLGFWLSELWPIAVVSLFACGVGISLFYPLGIARALAASEGKPDVASARAGLGAALAVGVGPFGLGALADGVGLHLAFLVVPALLVVAAVGVRLSPHPSPR
jgi:predicted MFS family arabinose efflux permease